MPGSRITHEKTFILTTIKRNSNASKDVLDHGHPRSMRVVRRTEPIIKNVWIWNQTNDKFFKCLLDNLLFEAECLGLLELVWTVRFDRENVEVES